MAADLERLAEYSRQKGFSEYADLLDATAKMGRSLGLGEHIEIAQTDEKVRVAKVTPKLDIALLAKALSPEKTPTNGLSLVEITQLAEHFNEVLGAELSDDTNMQDLRLPRIGNYGDLRDVSAIVKSLYTRAIDKSARNAKTLGELRSLTESDLLQQRQMGEKSVRFVVRAFKKSTE